MGVFMFLRCFRATQRALLGEEVDAMGSLARDHLANERTFLAWARTSLVFVGSGVGLHQFYQYAVPHGSTGDPEATKNDQEHMYQLRTNVVAASSSLVCVGFGILSFANLRYFAVLNALNRGKFIPN